MKLHENDNYMVVADQQKSRYLVVNLKTGIAELDDEKSLPNAINFAEHANSFLVNRLWDWIAPQGKASRVDIDKGAAGLESEFLGLPTEDEVLQ